MPLLYSNHPTEQQLQIFLPILITIAFSCVIFEYTVSPFTGFSAPDIDHPLRRWSADVTLYLLDDMGLGFLTYNGSFCLLILGYLSHLNNLTAALNLNLSTLDPDVLMFVLGRLRFLIANHELIFHVLSNFVGANEVYDLQIDYDPQLLEISVRNAGNNLYTLYHNIERELNLVSSDLPVH